MAAARGKLLDFVNTRHSQTVDKHIDALLETHIDQPQSAVTEERETA